MVDRGPETIFLALVGAQEPGQLVEDYTTHCIVSVVLVVSVNIRVCSLQVHKCILTVCSVV